VSGLSRKIFLTGASGCVGHYVLEELLKDPSNEIYALVRNPHHFLNNTFTHPQVVFVKGELKNLTPLKEILKEMDYVIHLATPWGGDELIPINVNATRQLWDLLNPEKIKKILYFSTASILGPGNKVIDQAATLGTLYIRTKYQTYYLNQNHPLKDKIYTFFPTWIFGGDLTHPYSHASMGIKTLPRLLKILRHFKIDFKFHFIHAADIAVVVNQVMQSSDFSKKEIILGQKALSLRQFTLEACEYFKIKKTFGFLIPSFLIRMVGKLLGDRLSDWDRYCLKQRHFVFDVTNPETFGLKSRAATTVELIRAFPV